MPNITTAVPKIPPFSGQKGLTPAATAIIIEAAEQMSEKVNQEHHF